MFQRFQMNGSPFETIKKRVVFRGVTTGSFAVAAVGQVLALDTTLASADTTSGYNPTAGTSKGNSATATNGPGGVSLQPIDLIYSSAVEPLGESATAGQIYCVVTDLLDGAGATGTEIEVVIQGRVQAKVASATYVIGSLLMMSATETNRELVALAVTTNAGQRMLAMVETGGTTIVSATVQFFGFGGLLAQNAIAN